MCYVNINASECVHLRGDVQVWMVDITAKKGVSDSVSCGGVNGENERNGGAGQQESRDEV